ncbi:MAG TPA: enoyl-CoA hydratase-related protein, partial [Bacilli bacterium]|nr:enoyl-CoA hydratase-related protein [Bacilli bacterium]
AEAFEIGLVNQVVAPESLMEEAKALAATIAKQAPIAVQKSKKAINDGWDMAIDKGIDYEVELFAQCFETEDQKNGMNAFLKKEKVEYKGK